MKQLAICVLLVTFQLCRAESEPSSSSVKEANVSATELKGHWRREWIVPEIVGAGQAPYHAAVFLDDGLAYTFLCSGSLISPQYVLTSRQCLENVNESDVSVALGVLRLNEIDANRGTWSVLRVVRPIDYDRDDLALLQLETSATLNGNVQTIRPASSTGYRGQNPFARCSTALSGWGVSRNGPLADGGDLKATQHWVMFYGNCRAWSFRNYRFTVGKNQLCTKWDNYVQCIADLGSPLVARAEDGSLLQIGVASYNLGSCSRQPIIFTSVTSYYDWISIETGIRF